MPHSLIELDGVTKKYRRQGAGKHITALDNISFTVSQGESLGVCGESGAGKSSLARIILGLESFDAGRMFVDGKEICGTHRHQPLHRFIQMVWQDPREYLNPYYTVADHVIEALRIFAPQQQVAVESQAKALLASVGISWFLAGRRPHELSGGQCQRVSIARALAARPKILICDEALAGLDIPEQVRIIRLLTDLQKTNLLTYVVIDHNLNVIRHLCNRMAVLKDGRIVETGTTEELFNRPCCSYTRRLIHTFFNLGGDRLYS